MARANNFPQAGLEKIDPKTVQAITMSLVDLYNKGKPKTDNEVRQRVNEYFEYCQASSLRPGVETLRTALHVSRSTLYEWSQGRNCSSERAEIIQGARSIIDSFLEQAMLSLENKEPPPNFILDQQLCFCSPFFSEQLMYP